MPLQSAPGENGRRLRTRLDREPGRRLMGFFAVGFSPMDARGLGGMAGMANASFSIYGWWGAFMRDLCGIAPRRRAGFYALWGTSRKSR